MASHKIEHCWASVMTSVTLLVIITLNFPPHVHASTLSSSDQNSPVTSSYGSYSDEVSSKLSSSVGGSTASLSQDSSQSSQHTTVQAASTSSHAHLTTESSAASDKSSDSDSTTSDASVNSTAKTSTHVQVTSVVSSLSSSATTMLLTDGMGSSSTTAALESTSVTTGTSEAGETEERSSVKAVTEALTAPSSESIAKTTEGLPGTTTLSTETHNDITSDPEISSTTIHDASESSQANISISETSSAASPTVASIHTASMTALEETSVNSLTSTSYETSVKPSSVDPITSFIVTGSTPGVIETSVEESFSQTSSDAVVESSSAIASGTMSVAMDTSARETVPASSYVDIVTVTQETQSKSPTVVMTTSILTTAPDFSTDIPTEATTSGSNYVAMTSITKESSAGSSHVVEVTSTIATNSASSDEAISTSMAALSTEDITVSMTTTNEETVTASSAVQSAPTIKVTTLVPTLDATPTSLTDALTESSQDVETYTAATAPALSTERGTTSTVQIASNLTSNDIALTTTVAMTTSLTETVSDSSSVAESTSPVAAESTATLADSASEMTRSSASITSGITSLLLTPSEQPSTSTDATSNPDLSETSASVEPQSTAFKQQSTTIHGGIMTSSDEDLTPVITDDPDVATIMSTDVTQEMFSHTNDASSPAEAISTARSDQSSSIQTVTEKPATSQTTDIATTSETVEATDGSYTNADFTTATADTSHTDHQYTTATVSKVKSERFRIKFSGDCSLINNNETLKGLFEKAVIDGLTAKLGLRDDQPVNVDDVQCGSVYVTVTIDNLTENDDISGLLENFVNSGNFTISIPSYGLEFNAEEIEDIGVSPTVEVVTPTTKRSTEEDEGLTNIQIILIIICSVVGGSIVIVIIVGLIYTCKNRNKSKKFELGSFSQRELQADDFTLVKMDSPNSKYHKNYTADTSRALLMSAPPSNGDRWGDNPHDSATLPLPTRSVGHTAFPEDVTLVSLESPATNKTFGLKNPGYEAVEVSPNGASTEQLISLKASDETDQCSQTNSQRNTESASNHNKEGATLF